VRILVAEAEFIDQPGIENMRFASDKVLALDETVTAALKIAAVEYAA
jgi:hypothetical protein